MAIKESFYCLHLGNFLSVDGYIAFLLIVSQLLTTFTEFLQAFITARSYRFVGTLSANSYVFAGDKASLGLVWA